jgi:mutator protein MutT
MLIAQRPAGKHMAGAWEFPGGKIEPGETALDALARELHEELGVSLGPGPHRPLIRVRHDYPDRRVRIAVWVVADFRGNPQSRDDQELRWCEPDQLLAAGILAADSAIVAALRLPAHLPAMDTNDYFIVPHGRAAERRGVMRLRGILCAGSVQAVVARAHADFIVLAEPMAAEPLRELCGTVEIPLFVCGMSMHEAWTLGASGTHAIAAGSRADRN